MFDRWLDAFLMESLIIVSAGALMIVLPFRGSKREKTRNPSLPTTDVEELRKTIERLQLEIRRWERKPSRKMPFMLLLLGAIVLVCSVIFASSILAFVGLWLLFLGALLLFIRPVSYVRRDLLDSTVVSSVTNIDRILRNLKYEGKSVFLPPKYLKESEQGIQIVPAKTEKVLPLIKQLSQKRLSVNPQMVYLVPLGQGLVNLFEAKLGTDFSKIDLNYLQVNLPKLLVEDLEILGDFQMNIDDGVVYVKMTNSIYSNLCKELGKAKNVCSNIGCPLCSSVACALAKATGKAVVIEKNEFHPKGKIIETRYRIIEVK